MLLFNLPNWLQVHLFPDKKFSDLSEEEIGDLKQRLSGFKNDHPDVSVVIPAWNEENNIFRTLSSLASNITTHKVEIIVINNNSTDHTQEVLNRLEVKSYFQPLQGITFARQMGLEKAAGIYHLCADSDTYYPPHWIDLMTKPMIENKEIVGVYGRYHFIPVDRKGRFSLYLYEKITGVLIRIRKINTEFVNVLGFNMGFVTAVGRDNGGFKVNRTRKFSNAADSADFVEESEDGTMALNLLKKGKLKLVTDKDARVFTSSRRLMAEGGILKSFLFRLKLHSKKITEYISG